MSSSPRSSVRSRRNQGLERTKRLRGTAVAVQSRVIAILSAEQHHHQGPSGSGSWAAFATGGGLGSLLQFDEHVLPPGTAPEAWHAEGELLTYVREGNITCDGAGLLQATEVQLVVDGSMPWQLRNRSKTESARVFQLTFAPSEHLLSAAYAQRRFTVAERRERWKLIASPDAREGSLMLLARARVYSALLHDGVHVVHALSPGHSAWLHVVDGACAVDGTRLSAGDAASFVDERSVSVIARGGTELLLVEVVPGAPTPAASTISTPPTSL